MTDLAAYAPHTKLNTAAAADYCGSTESTFEKLRLTGGGPVFIKNGRRVVYQVSDLDAWLSANRRRSTSDLASRGMEAA